jgi:hypothetical protein
VFAGLFHIENVTVARFASLMPRMPDRKIRDFRQRIPPVMAELAKALGNKPGSEADKDGHSDQEDPDHSPKMF